MMEMVYDGGRLGEILGQTDGRYKVATAAYLKAVVARKERVHVMPFPK